MGAPRTPEQLLYSPTHEWVAVEADAHGAKVAVVGISAFAVESLTDLVFMQLPEVGRTVKAGDSIGEIESVKAVSDLYAPVGGEIVAVNASLPDRLETLQTDPYQDGWIAKIRLSDEAELGRLLDLARYQHQIAEEGH